MGPQQFESNVRTQHKFRFIALGDVTGVGITDTNLVEIVGNIATSTTELTCFNQSSKIKKIEVWSAPSTQGSNSTVSVEWFGFQNSPNVEHSDTTLSVTKNAYINSSPPPSSLAKFWQKATGNQVFVLTCPENSIVDITLQCILTDDESNTSIEVTGPATVGNTYYAYLDQNNGSMLKPVSLQSIV